MRDEAGQGTIEYVGLMVLMATVLTAVVKTSGDMNLPDTIVGEIKQQIGKVSK
jgi:Flp pilus assembly pilin Flp